MAILSKQIGWSQESNLLWEILRQTDKLSCALCSLNATNENNPCYMEVLFNGAGSNIEGVEAFYFETIDDTSVLPVGLNIFDVDNNVIGWRLYGGNNIAIKANAFINSNISFLNDGCGIVKQLNNRVFKGSKLTYVNLPGITEISVVETFMNTANLTIVKLPNLLTISGESTFADSGIKNLSLPKLTSITTSTTFQNCNLFINLSLPQCSIIGSTDCSINEDNFNGITGNSMTLTIKGSLMTCDAGDPDADIQELLAFNPAVTIITT